MFLRASMQQPPGFRRRLVFNVADLGRGQMKFIDEQFPELLKCNAVGLDNIGTRFSQLPPGNQPLDDDITVLSNTRDLKVAHPSNHMPTRGWTLPCPVSKRPAMSVSARVS